MTLGAVAEDLATLFGIGTVAGVSDAALLRRFVEGRGDASSQAAFEALVARHGPMVRGVCRRVVNDRHAADDAFQATFLVLARKAASVRLDGSLGGWLHGVSVRVARRARPGRRHRSLEGIDVASADTSGSDGRDELRQAIDAEIARLPRHYRAVVVLCDVQGLDQQIAARRLRCPVGTVQSRLHRARRRLRAALTRRGLAPTCVGLFAATEISQGLAASTVAMACFARSGVEVGAVPAGVGDLATWWTRRVLMQKSGWIAAALIGLGGIGGVGLVSMREATARDGPVQGPVSEKPIGRSAVPGGSFRERVASLTRDFDGLYGGEVEELIAFDFQGMTAGRCSMFMLTLVGDDPTPRGHLEPRVIDGKEVQVLVPGATKEYTARLPALRAAYAEKMKRRVEAARRLMDIAEEHPADPTSFDAATAVFRRSWINGQSAPLAAATDRAIDLLMKHHIDDPRLREIATRCARLGHSSARERFLRGLAAAPSKENRGAGRFALANALERKGALAEVGRNVARKQDEKRGEVVKAGFDVDAGQLLKGVNVAVLEPLAGTDFFSGNVLDGALCDPSDKPRLIACDPAALRREARQMYEGIARECGDLPRYSDLTLAIDRLAGLRETLGVASRDRINALNGLSVGFPAPALEGKALDGTTTRLADLKGKVVVLVFWRKGEACRAELEHDRALVKRMKGRPFVLIGINDEATADARITWPTWGSLTVGKGEDASGVQVHGYPTALVIDADGILRHMGGSTVLLDAVLDDLVNRAEGKGQR